MKLKNLFERNIARLTTTINVKFDVETTTHAIERQDRHYETRIEDQDIINTIQSTLPRISRMLMLDEININSPILLKNISNNLNIVGVLQQGANDELDFVVITVMIKPNFAAKPGTKVIYIK